MASAARLVIELECGASAPRIYEVASSSKESEQLASWVKGQPGLRRLAYDAVRLLRGDEPERKPAIPAAVITLPLEGAPRGVIRHCNGDQDVAARVLDWIERDEDAAELLDAYRRIRDRRQAA